MGGWPYPAGESLFFVLQRLGRLERRRPDRVGEPNVVALELVTHAEVGDLRQTMPPAGLFTPYTLHCERPHWNTRVENRPSTNRPGIAAANQYEVYTVSQENKTLNSCP